MPTLAIFWTKDEGQPSLATLIAEASTKKA